MAAGGPAVIEGALVPQSGQQGAVCVETPVRVMTLSATSQVTTYHSAGKSKQEFLFILSTTILPRVFPSLEHVFLTLLFPLFEGLDDLVGELCGIGTWACLLHQKCVRSRFEGKIGRGFEAITKLLGMVPEEVQ
jgi:hypothetical protein